MELQELKQRSDLQTVLESYGLDLHTSGTVLSSLCPFHDETTPSLKVWGETQRWKCFGCGLHGDVIDFIKNIENCTTLQAAEKLQEQAFGPPIIRKKRTPPTVEPISNSIVEEYHQTLKENDTVIRWLEEHRCWSRDSIEKYSIGLHNRRIQIPIPHPLTKKWVDIRQYRPRTTPKMLPYDKERGAWPYILGKVEDVIVITEGEPDALAVASLGYTAATNTCGAMAVKGVWHQWCGLLLASNIVLAFDNDEPGENARKTMKRLTGGVSLVFPELGRKADITDAIIAYGPDEIRRRIDSAITNHTGVMGAK